MTRFLRAGIMVAAVLITVLALFGFRDFTRSPYTGIIHHNLVIQDIEAGSPNESLQLQAGDRILAVDGEIPRNLNHFNYLTGSNTTHVPQVYAIVRSDSVFDATVAAVPQPPDRFYRKFAMMLTGLIFTLVGFIVILKRPDVLGVLLSVLCLLFSFLVTERPVTSIGLFHIAGELVHDLLFIFLPAFVFHFLLLFPGKEIRNGSRRAKAVRVLYFPPTMLFVAIFALALVSYSRGVPSEVINLFETFIVLYWVVYIIASIVSFFRSFAASEKVQRIKFSVVFFGVAIGIIPLSLVMLIKHFQPAAYIPHLHLSAVFLSFVSISFAYAILKHGAFDLGIVVRKVLAFVILSGVLVSLYYVLVYVLGERFGSFLGVKPQVITGIFIVLIALALIPARTWITKAVNRFLQRDRKVFREQVLEFSRLIQNYVAPEGLTAFITGELVKLSDVEFVHLFLREESGNYLRKRSSPEEARIPLTSFPPHTELIKRIRNSHMPLMLEYIDTLWIKNALDRISRELISISDASVIIPLIEHQELIGFILVGRKRSGKPFTRADAEIFELIGERSASALRNIELYRDSIEKEKLEEELHVASEIQKQLLPESIPTLQNAVLKGGIRTTREVGGDFYDFVELEPGKIGIAVADVSGKGIPASVLMTSLKASFRAEASQDRSPREVLAALNELLYEKSDAIRFATFFYATYDERESILQYSNGGSFPPLIIGADASVSRLMRGGIPIGVDTEVTYNEGVVKLKPDDLLVIFSDGIMDQENEKEEPFGEKRLIEFFRNNLSLSPDHLIEKLFATLFAFGNNNLKDDMTIVLLRKNNS